MKKILLNLILAVSIFMTQSTVNAQNGGDLPETVVDIATSDSNFTTLVAALTRGDLTTDFVSVLSGEGPFTVFAPTNDAFAALLTELGLASLDDIDAASLEAVLKMHVVSGKVMSTDLTEGMMAPSLEGDMLTFSLMGGASVTDPNERKSNITTVDLEAQNGVVHVIDKVILPDQRPETVVDIATSDENFSILVEALTREDLSVDFVSVLSGDGPFTVFAPTNDAFAALLTELGVASLDDIDAATLEAVLKMHVVSGNVMSSDLSDGMMAATLQGEEITFNLDDGASITDLNGRESNITAVDVEAQNGVVHVIDKVILPDVRPETVVDIATGNPNFSILVAALTRDDLNFDFIKTLTGKGPFTVFAPTNDAFAALLSELGVASLEDIPASTLEDVLKTHIVAGEIKSDIISNYLAASAINGEKLSFSTEGGVFVVDPNGRNSNVLIADVLAKNGVVHAVDKVLLPDPRPETVVDIITSSEDHTTLEAAVVAAGLVETLQGDGPFTVFAPTDAAFAALPEGTLDALLADPSGQLTDILLYHVVAGKAMSSDLSNGQKIETVLGQNITVTITSEGVFVNGAQVAVADIEAQNGVVHVIDAVILPTTKSVVDIVVESENHTTLEAAVVAAGLVETLQGDGPFTVFAPTDAAFAALPEGTVDALLEDPSGQLTDILLYHVVAGKAMSSDLSNGQKIETVLGQDLMVTVSSEGVFINDAQVTVADIEATNGVVHVIDAVLLPAPKTVVDVIVESEDHTTLEAAVVAAGLVETLQGEGPFTVFAPTDAAFAALPEGTLDALLADPSGQLTDILLHHVVAGKAMSSDLSDGQKIETVLGQNITVSITSEGVYINNAQVTVADIEAANGVIHVIDAVLLPSTKTVVDIVVESEDHTMLEAAVVAAGLVETLQGDGPFTVFAPTDAAFAALPEGTLDALLADPSGQLTDILLYHVVAAKAMSSDLSDGQEIETVLGQNITVTITSEGVFINDAQVTVADIEATNGVVHVIDAVLLPNTKTVVDIVVESEDHTTLEAAVIAAGLVETLQGDGPFTVFAPTDAAFAALPEGTLDALLADPSGQLTDILLYHVVAGSAMSGDLSDGQKIETVLGQNITVTITPEGVFINDAQVTVADIEATNGVVHVIDAVLLPTTKTVVDIVVESEDHTTLEAAVIAAGLVETLQGDGPFTVFAPTDAAFAALPEGTLDALLADPSGQLTDILLYHVVAGKAMSSDLSDGQEIETVLGQNITVTITSEGVFINDAQVTVADIEATNGVVHVIDKVIMPKAEGVKVMNNSTLGNIITDSYGRTLYFFTPDAMGMSNCVDGCLNNWPVFYAENLMLESGLDSADFGTITHPSGVMQNTYKGWPLYYFVNDTKAGDVKGEGLINKWFVAKPDYTIMLIDNQLTGKDGVNYKGDYTPGDETIQYLVDDYGNTLYTWINDLKDQNKFTDSLFAKNSVWPIYEQDMVVVPSTLDASDFEVIDVFGRKQLTFKGWPLYYFGEDMMQRGSNMGVSVPAPGIWPVAVPDMDEAIAFGTVVDIATSDPSFSSLVAALTRGDLSTDFVSILSGEGPFTVFAPTNDAFTDLLAELGVASLNDIDAATLEAVLKMHVVSGKVMSTDLSEGMTAPTFQGEEITFSLEGGASIFDLNGRESNITAVDVEAKNGVVHVIDKVILPDLRPETVVDIAVSDSAFTSLVTALTRDDLSTDFVSVLTGDGPFTVFAPTNDAFAALLAELGVASLDEVDAATLEAVLKMHVVAGYVLSGDLSDGMMAPTFQGEEITFSLNGGASILDNNGRESNITAVDLQAKNGVVHVIDKVILPDLRPETVVDIATGNEDFSILVAALIREDVRFDFIKALTGKGPFTVFAPTNDAFVALLNELGFASLDDIPAELLEDILKTHIVAGEIKAENVSEFLDAKTIGGHELTFSTDGGAKVIDPTGGMSNITIVDLLAKNGIVHAIDRVLLPVVIPPAPKSVVDIIVESENHTTLEAAVVAAGLVETLQGDGPFTVFAPTDAAFAALPEGTLDALLADPSGQLTDILLYHVVAGKAMSSDLMDGQKIETVLGQNTTVTITSEGVFINNAQVTVADIEASNGVVHVIDAVLLPTTKTVVDIVVESENHTTLEAAVVAAGLVETLQGDGPFTVFAPTDAAFAALPEGTLDALLADPSGQLTDILLYHVVAGKAMSSDLMDGQKIETVLGQNITVTVTSEGVFINDAQVTVADIEASNGVVHVIDAVLLPNTKTVVDIVVESENHTILEAALASAGFVETLQGDGPFTVFAPTDAAFADLLTELGVASLEDIDAATLAATLQMHVVTGKVMSTDLTEGMMVNTLQGEEIMISLVGGVSITDPNDRVSYVTVADLEATNGVVHVIDKVILPDLNATSVNDLNAAEFSVYPNPADQFLNIRSDEPISDVKIMNLTGKVVLHRSMLSNNERIDVSSYSPGIYFVVVENNGSASTKKIIIR